jgi:hypothetical protein
MVNICERISIRFASNTFLNFFLICFIGAFAELAGGLFYVPADVVSQRLQVQNLNSFNHNSRLYAGPLGIFLFT